mgnify:CR=1 FL=1
MNKKAVIEICKVLSNETRFNILLWLKDPESNFPPQGEHLSEEIDLQGGVCAGSIFQKTGIAQSTVSHYLDMMQRAGLLESERHGKWTYYRRCEDTIRELREYMNTEL